MTTTSPKTTTASQILTNSDRSYRNISIRIDLASIRHNLKCVKALAPSSKIIAVVKADAYGHGMLRVLAALQEADAFAVATMEEGIALRRSGESRPVMVLQGYRTANQMYDCIAMNLWPVIHDRYQLDIISSRKLRNLSCWIKFDTGMSRTGLRVENASSVHRRMMASSVEVVGIMSHLANADNVKDIGNDRQLRQFNSIKWPDEVDRSLANSAATASRGDLQFDWVRPGILLYGASPFEHISAQALGLQPAMRVTAPVIAVRDVKRGQRIGYGGRFLCSKNMKVAVIGAGYGDGYPRSVPDGTTVMLGNQRCPLVGKISMDSMVVDISALTVPPPIDYPVTLWGHGRLPVDEIAGQSGTIPYELLCSIRGQRQWIDATSEINVRNIDKDLSLN